MKLRILVFLFLYASSILAQDVESYLVLSDTDTLLSEGLMRKENQSRTASDSLTYIQIHENGKITKNSIYLSNSIVNNAKPIAVSTDRTTAYVLQSRGEFPDEMLYSPDLDWKMPLTRTLLNVDITDPKKIKFTDTLTVGNTPAAVVLSPDGKSLALTVAEKHSEIIRIILEENELQYVFRHPHAIYSKLGNIRATDISWHPSGKYFAVTLHEDGTVAFYTFIETTYGIKLALLGAPVEIGRLPTKTEFSADGKYCIVINRDNQETNSELLSIKFDEGGNHSIAGRTHISPAPRIFALSPTGNQIAVLNLKSLILPGLLGQFNSSSADPSSTSVMLFTLNPDGTFTQTDSVDIEESSHNNIAFSTSGKKIVLSISEYEETKRGGLEFLEISDDNKLHKMDVKISTPRGTHFVKSF